MKTKLFLKVGLMLIFCCLINYSCENPDDNPNGVTHLGDPNVNDRSIPYSYNNWMANIDGNKYLSEITIPGTHDCGADLHSSEQGAASSVTIAQDFRLSNQLLLGVRWFDVRLNDDDGIMTVFHGPYYLHKNFNDLILQALAFLNNNPTEVVVFMIKQEHSSRGDDAFANGVMGYLNWSYPGRFWMGDHIPQLSEVRGQIVITRQFWGTHGYEMGVPLMWNDNTTGSYGSSDNGAYLYAQDHYSLFSVDLDTKIGEIEDCITKAHNEPYPYRCYYLNFTSGERDIQSLQDIAAYINPRINTFLLSKPTWHNCGVIFVNFAGGSDDGEVPNDLVKTIVNMNDFGTIPTVVIGTQVWMKYNLNVTHYLNGDPIFNITDAAQWSNLTTGAYCNYNNDTSNASTYGRLYNWYIVNDPRGLAPAGFHIPTDAEWTTLVNYLGGASVAGGKLKETGTSHWLIPNTGATNEVGFTALPGGWRDESGSFNHIRYTADWWTTSEYNSSNAWDQYIHSDSQVTYNANASKKGGYSIRCIKN